MPSSMELSVRSTGTSRDMGHVGGQERSSGQQQNVIAVNEKIQLPPRENGLAFQGKHRVRHSFSQPYIDRKCELRQNASAEKVAHSISSENDRRPQPGGRACDDELLGHMSNLPVFVLKVDEENTVQEKALNFGVLDWKRLEKWKYTERMPRKLPNRTSPTASGPPKMVPSMRKQLSSHNCNPSLSHPAKQPMPHGSRFSSPQRQPPSPHSSRLNLSKAEKNGSHLTEGEYAESIKSEGEAPSSMSKQVKLNISLLSPYKTSFQRKKSDMRLDEVILTSQCCPGDPQNIVPQVPKHFHEKTCSESFQSTESRTSLDAQLSLLAEKRSSDIFSPQELHSGEFSSDIPHSCPLPSGAVERHNLLISQAIDVDTCTRANFLTSISSKANCSMVNEKTARPSILAEASNRKPPIIAELPSVKGRSLSPTCRFSIYLGKMSRSFGFKESSSFPQLSSSYTTIRSGPARPEVERDEAHTSSRGRSSPLRRLLDPLLKHKTSETVCPPKGSLSPMFVNITGSDAPSQDKKPEASTCQALLQLTFRNGLPFFKLVVENNKDMLAAAVKRLPASGKSEPCIIYSFYSIHEIRKKSTNWMNHGSKSKAYSLGYNIIGQMKISNTSRLTEDTRECDARECVLYGVDPAQVDKQILAFVPSKEIAAIIVNSSREKINDGEFGDKNRLSEGKGSYNGTVVLLPGGVHGIPIKGAPSSLISRWRSGGLCDCGGWDVGCKLRILSNSEECSNVLQESVSSSIDHVNLCMQDGGKKSKSLFSLKPFGNEFYSIELEASVSLLKAFAISVAHITCSKFPETIDTEGLLQQNVLLKPM